MESKITSKGQITLPKAMRERLGVSPGDQVRFFLHPDGSVALLPVRPIGDLRGFLRPRAESRPTTIAEMNEAIAEGAVASGMAGVRPRRRKK